MIRGIHKKIRVLECIRQGQIGGGETHLLSLVENIDRTKYEPIVLSFTDGPMITKLADMNISTHIIHTERPFDISVWKKVRTLILIEKIELIHCHGTRAVSNVFRAAKSLKIPLIYSIHGWSFHEDQHPLVKKIRIWGEKFLTSVTSRNIAVSESSRASGKSHMPSFKASVIQYGINQKKFDPDLQFKNIRGEINLDSSALLILFVARFTKQKQPLSMIRAFADALRQQPKLHLLMVGDGDEKKEALELVSQLSIESRVHFLPFRNDVPDVLAAADIFVLPSLWEGLPIGLLEAMSMGKPVIATNVDGTKEVITNGQNGLLIETQDLVANLSRAIVKLAESESLRDQLSKNVLQTIKADFNAESMTRKIEKIYEDLTCKENRSE
jgi:glycosyltransferase involved in cell wall biosynthesis